MSVAPGEITRLLLAARDGDATSRERLFTLVYNELHILARSRLRSTGEATVLDAPSLVHEAYLRLARGGELPGINRRTFFAYASSIMHGVLVDYLRERSTAKRGGNVVHVTLTMGGGDQLAQEPELDGLESSLASLERVDPRAHQIVVMRYFGGLSVEEVADELGVSAPTVKRGWRKARAFLFTQLHPSEGTGLSS